MGDRCENCTLRGDLKACTSAPCSVRESWYVTELQDTNLKLVEVIQEIEKIANDQTQPMNLRLGTIAGLTRECLIGEVEGE